MSNKKCKLCEKRFVDKTHLIRHIDKEHNSQIPPEWTAARYENYLRTGKTHGNCVICGENTGWNEATGKYCRMCTKQSCRDKARETAEANLIKTKGVTHSQMLQDPEFQRKMVYSKGTSGVYHFNDNECTIDIMYDSSYVVDFLEMLENFLNWPSNDVVGPSPNTYIYHYDKKRRFYIPDIYLPSIHTEVEIKDGGTNPNMHPKIQAVDKEKERLKDEAMKKEKVNYVKIVNKDYTSFFKLLYRLKEEDREEKIGGSRQFIHITESTGYDSYANINMQVMSYVYSELSKASSDYDVTSLYSKLESMENKMKIDLNEEDHSPEMRMEIEKTIRDIESVKADLDKRLTK